MSGAKPAPQAGKAVVGVEHEHAVGIQAVDDLGLRPGHALDTAETLQVGAAGIVQHRDIGPHQTAQVTDLARVTGAHLDHRKLFVAQPAERQRYADFIVEVAPGRQHIAAAGEDRRSHLLERGLAIAAGDTDHACRTAHTPLLTQPPETAQGVRDLHH